MKRRLGLNVKMEGGMRFEKKMRGMATALAVVLLTAGGLGAADSPVLRMATTTSTDNTGLLDYLAPEFQKDTGTELQWVAVGTGKALELGRNCDVDILMVHAPPAEKQYIEEGFGVDRRQIMFNDFVIIGPKGDPASVAGLSATEALKTIHEKKAVFVSRGDNSGTNKKEIGLWKEAGLDVPDKADWYVQTGQGMISTINVAVEREGYTLTDRGTYIKYEANMQGEPPLVALVEGDPQLRNQYSVITVNPERCDNVDKGPALQFTDWVTSPEAQQLIGDFKLMGKQLFIPNADH